MFLSRLPSGGYQVLTALASLCVLALDCCATLPGCLSDLRQLQALCICDTGASVDHSQGEPAAILSAALPRLTSLTRLSLWIDPGTPDGEEKQPIVPSPLVPAALPRLAGCSHIRSLMLHAAGEATHGLRLPSSLSGLHQLAAPAQLLCDSLAPLTAATGLQLLVALWAGRTLQRGELVELLSWAAELPRLERLLLEASKEQAGDVRAAAAFVGAHGWAGEASCRLPNGSSVLVLADAFEDDAVDAMISAEL